MRSFLQKLLRDERGQSTISTAITFSVMLAFTIGLMYVCMAYYQHERISEMAREGTRYAALHGTTCKTSSGSSCTATPAQIQTYITNLGYPDLGGGTLATPIIRWSNGVDNNVGSPACNTPGSPVIVVLSYQFTYTLPFLGPGHTQILTMSSTSQMTILV